MNYIQRKVMFILLFAVVLRIDTDSREMDNQSDEVPPSSTDHRPELQASPLPQMMKGSLWETLATVSYDPYAPTFVPIFSDTLKKVNGKYVELVGFMIPLSAEKKQTRFVLTPYSLGGCSFCVGGGGPESLVDIRPSKPIEFTYDPITITGRLELLQKDSSELFFRISKAEVMDKGDMKNNPDDKY